MFARSMVYDVLLLESCSACVRVYCAIGIVCIIGFKQKTAYEKRISDWSSDVCSSDLKASRFCTNRRVLAEAGESIAKFVNQGLIELGEIGRASCRERVCQYV